MQIVSIYQPVQEQLASVEETLRRASHIEGFPLLAELLDYILSWPGKHIRPVVTLLASRFHEHDPARAVAMASAVEMLHIATLVHDDTVDAAKTRRGRATVSSLWGRNAAVLTGDYVFARAAKLVSETGNMEVIGLFAETVMALSCGQLRESSSAYSIEQSRRDYWKRIEEKTASLFRTASQTGAVLSNAPPSLVEALRTYGYNLGMAFQVADDILDFEGSEEVAGKPVGGDLAQGVLTLPAILFMERTGGERVIREAFADPGDIVRVQAAVDAIRACRDVMDEANEVADRFAAQARHAIAPLPDTPEKRSLLEMTEAVTHRQR